jgi:nickel/cobalt exporter
MSARRWLPATLLALQALLTTAPAASAHPLGNFTINHYAAIVVSPDQIAIRWVLDMAEIPAFAARRQIDTNRDGMLTADEVSSWADATVPDVLTGLDVEVNGVRTALREVDRQVTFPPGQGGLSTLRLVVDLVAASPPSRGSLTLRDGTYPERIGWHEITARAESGMRIDSSNVPAATVSDELRRYPADALTNPVDVRTAAVSFERSAATGQPGGTSASAAAGGPASRSTDVLADLAGGNLTPLTAVLAVLLALGLGAVHGISPGHGKALVAAYLIGNQGSLRQAAWLGITVAVTHTVGVFVLGLATLVATELLVPERIITWLSLGSGLLVVALGGALLWSAWRQRQRDTSLGHSGLHAHPHSPAHTHEEGGHVHPHRHTPREGTPPQLSAAGIAGLGLVGGMVPSASALLVLLVAVTTGRLVLGIALIVAFGVGMSVVLAGISASVVLVRRRVELGGASWARHRLIVAAARFLPVGSALAVLTIGLVLSVGAARALG